MTVVVLGSGVAGLVAALAAAHRGAPVTVLESAERAGGTTALSGGVTWAPGYREDDPPVHGLRYLQALGLGDHDPALCETFVDQVAGVARLLEARTPLRWHTLDYPDYHAELDGGREDGRSIEPDPLRPEPRIAALVRNAPNITAAVTYAELARGEVDRQAIERRGREGVMTLGRALIAALLTGCLERGVQLCMAERARALVVDRGRVTGVRTDAGCHRGAVVLASGGFERNVALVRALLRGPMLAPAGVPTNVGDGLRMAMAAGSALGNLSEAWWAPAIRVPGECIDDAPMYRVILTERSRPGSVIVDRRGRRFADEGQNYNDLGRALHDFDPAAYAYPRVPAWMVFDGAYRRRYHLGPIRRGEPDPDWLASGGSPGELAERIGIDGAALDATLSRFNRLSDGGHDDDFGRGDYAYDRFMGDPRAAHPVLAPLREPPFYAVEVLPGCLGTKGGPRTDTDGRVLSATDGEPIPGLHAAGNAAANPFGCAYPGAGGTIGPALVFGHRAGEAAAECV